ncbi:MAG: hypothetical protein GY881_02955 [Gammaproteobacteria bacterium]|nr:hypothetical protein [Gammaproteobacteria bacterium]
MTRDIAIDRVAKAAQHAWAWSSMSPERRAKSYVAEFTQELDEYRAKVEKIDPSSVSDFTKRYTDKAVAWLGALSRTASSMVTGPANFPVARNRKRLDTEHKRGQELFSFPDYYITKLKKRIKKESGFDLPENDLQRQINKLAELKRSQDLMKAANKAIRSKKDVESKLKDIGFTDKQIIDIQQPDYAGRVGFAGYQLTNNNANIKRVEGRVKELEAKVNRQDKPQPALTFDGGEMVQNYTDDRFQILFDGIPAVEIRTQLKRNGLRWSPRNKAWQRKLTQNAIYAMGEVAKDLGISNQAYNEWAWRKKAVKETPKPAEPATPVLSEYRDNILKTMNANGGKDYALYFWSVVDREQLPANRKEDADFAYEVLLYQKPFKWSSGIANKKTQLGRIAAALKVAGYDQPTGAWKSWFTDKIPSPAEPLKVIHNTTKKEPTPAKKEHIGIVEREEQARKNKAEKAGGFDFIHEVGYSGKSVVKTYLPLPVNRGLKLNGEIDKDGYRSYWATDAEFKKLQALYPNNQYGDKQSYGKKYLNTNPKLAKDPKRPFSDADEMYKGFTILHEYDPQFKSMRYTAHKSGKWLVNRGPYWKLESKAQRDFFDTKQSGIYSAIDIYNGQVNPKPCTDCEDKEKAQAPTTPHHCDQLNEDIAYLEIEQSEQIKDLHEDVPELIILQNMPLITPASAEAETGGKVGTKGDISIGLTSSKKGVSVETAAELLTSEFPHQLPDEYAVRDTIIEILTTGKVNFRNSILQDEKELTHRIKEKAAQIKAECVNDNLPPAIDLAALQFAKAKAIAIKVKLKLINI